MNNTQFISIIKNLCKQKRIPMTSLLEKCSLRKSFVYDVQKRNAKPSIENIEKIAEFLNVSIDYLVGRTDQTNADESPTTSSAPTTQEPKLNEDELELIEMYRSLSKRTKHELMVKTYEMKDQDELARDRANYINYDVG